MPRLCHGCKFEERRRRHNVTLGQQGRTQPTDRLISRVMFLSVTAMHRLKSRASHLPLQLGPLPVL